MMFSLVVDDLLGFAALAEIEELVVLFGLDVVGLAKIITVVD